MRKQLPAIRRTLPGIAFLVVLSVVGAGCQTSTSESPAVGGRRVQNATVVARGAVPLQLSAYELEFPVQSGDQGQPRRAALLVDFFGDQGHVRGFTEWTSSGAEPQTYVTSGWAHQANVNGDLVTVFQLAVNAIGGASSRGTTPRAVRVVVHERSGDVTLTAHH
jgi:hypothetical protein